MFTQLLLIFSVYMIHYDEKNKTDELELKIKHYQDENIRLSNLVTSQNKKIEIMSSQIQNFENATAFKS